MDSSNITIDNVSKVFVPPFPWIRKLLLRPSGMPVQALKEVTLDIKRGEIFGLVGRNGQGKTTLIKVIAGLVQASSGTVRVMGYDPAAQGHEVKRRTGLVTSDDRSFYWRLTGLQNLLFFSRLHGLSNSTAMSRIETLVEKFEMKGLMERPFYEFSTGNKQRLGIIRALLHDPRILLLDEPTRSLDTISAQNLRNLILDWIREDPTRSILITTHNLSEIELFSDRVGILCRNRLVACAPLSDLVRTRSPRDRVTVTARSHLAPQGWESLRSVVPDIQVGAGEVESTRISFSTHNGDLATHRVISHLVSEGFEILECQTEKWGLNGVLAEIEKDAGDNESVA